MEILSVIYYIYIKNQDLGLLSNFYFINSMHYIKKHKT